jgi:TonB family protein
MSGPYNLELFTLSASGWRQALLRPNPDDKRLAAALAVSCLLHLAILLMPALGTGASALRATVLGNLQPGAARALDVRFRQPGELEAAVAVKSTAGAGTGGLPAGRAEGEPAPAQQPSHGVELIPMPAPAHYTVDQLTQRPRMAALPLIEVPKHIARSITGKVVLKVWIDELGRVESAEVEQTNLPEAISLRAAAAFRKLAFEPGEIDGRRVPVLLRFEVVYERGRQRF